MSLKNCLTLLAAGIGLIAVGRRVLQKKLAIQDKVVIARFRPNLKARMSRSGPFYFVPSVRGRAFPYDWLSSMLGQLKLSAIAFRHPVHCPHAGSYFATP